VYLSGGAGATAGGGSESLRDAEQKTVGPSRVKKREFAGPPVYWDPDRLLLKFRIALCRKQKTQIFRAFPIAAVENTSSMIHTEFRYKTDCKTAILRQKRGENSTFLAPNRILQF
jgi:hypothetical protein